MLMKLLTKELIQRFEEIGRQEGSKDPIVACKFFNPIGSQSWYATEYYPDEWNFFWYVTGMYDDEWGYFSLNELEEIKLPFWLTIERDLYFSECPISSIIKNI